MVGVRTISDDYKDQKINEIRDLLSDLTLLLEEYEILWLESAKKEGFKLIKRLYLWLIKFYKEKIEQLQNNINWKNPNIPSELIYLDNESLQTVHVCVLSVLDMTF